MTEVRHRWDLPDQMFFRMNNEFRSGNFTWFVILNGEVYSAYKFKHEAENEALELAKYFC